jgi:hypothetical protein
VSGTERAAERVYIGLFGAMVALGCLLGSVIG